MQNCTLTVQVPADAARAYEMASPEERRRVDEALRRRLRELMKPLPAAVGDHPATSQAGRSHPSAGIHPDVLAISALIPPDIDARAEYREYLMKKH